jgi:replicative superfamily II helicase
MIERGLVSPSDRGKKLASWLRENYHPAWSLAAGLEAGLGVHHGRIPRAIAQMMVREFDAGCLQTLICTSTLIEGVNTSAEAIFIYDKKINTTDFDFFSFQNIKGRVGRFMKHFIGDVFLYHPAPAEEAIEVEAPAFSDPDSAGDAILINMEAEDLGDKGTERVSELMDRSGLPVQLLRRYGALGIDRLSTADALIQKAIRTNPAGLLWHGMPIKVQRDTLFQIVHKAFVAGTRVRIGAWSAAQLSFFCYQLQSIRTTRTFLSWFVRSNTNEDKGEVFETALEFLRACEFSLPQMVAAVEALVQLNAPAATVDYSRYIVGIENHFRPNWMRGLEEMGVPTVISEKLVHRVPSAASLEDARAILTAVASGPPTPDLSDIEREILGDALVS